ncbi:MAG: hypothetical protein AAF456_17290 [Planctomycetota bacterium]
MFRKSLCAVTVFGISLILAQSGHAQWQGVPYELPAQPGWQGHTFEFQPGSPQYSNFPSPQLPGYVDMSYDQRNDWGYAQQNGMNGTYYENQLNHGTHWGDAYGQPVDHYGGYLPQQDYLPNPAAQSHQYQQQFHQPANNWGIEPYGGLLDDQPRGYSPFHDPSLGGGRN